MFRSKFHPLEDPEAPEDKPLHSVPAHLGVTYKKLPPEELAKAIHDVLYSRKPDTGMRLTFHSVPAFAAYCDALVAELKRTEATFYFPPTTPIVFEEKGETYYRVGTQIFTGTGYSTYQSLFHAPDIR